jgi:hypothetical protein
MEETLHVHFNLRSQVLSRLHHTRGGSRFLSTHGGVCLQHSTLTSFWLLRASYPATRTTYTSVQIQRALSRPRFGVDATIQCGGADSDELDEICYNFNVAGSAQRGIYVQVEPCKSDRRPFVLAWLTIYVCSWPDNFTAGGRHQISPQKPF